jgi:hypothetical protein
LSEVFHIEINEDGVAASSPMESTSSWGSQAARPGYVA